VPELHTLQKSKALRPQLAVSSKRPSTNSGQQSSKAPWYVIAGVIGGLAFVVWYLLFRGNGKSYKNLWDALGFPMGPQEIFGLWFEDDERQHGGCAEQYYL
jgi:hypothetical protein